jgi:hypothetical protein
MGSPASARQPEDGVTHATLAQRVRSRAAATTSVEPASRARVAWRGATVAVALNIGGMTMDLAIARQVPGVPLWPNVASALVGAALLVVVIGRWRRPSVRLGSILYLVNDSAVVMALWFTSRAYAESGRPWIPFQPDKLGMLTSALLAPEAWVAVLSISAHTAMCLIRLATFSVAARSQMVIGEPWATIVIAIFAFVLLGYRLKSLALEREIARAHAEVVTTRAFAKFLLAVRDLANSPLQTIAFAAMTVRQRHPDLDPVMRVVDRALDRLRELDERLRQNEGVIDWSRKDESFDALEELRTRTGRPSAADGEADGGDS